jgi:hypothetical protein
VNDRDNFPAASGPAAQATERAPATVQAGATTLSLKVPDFTDEADTPSLLAEWALWGKEEGRTALHVLRCSNGALSGDDFREIITRYATGVKEELPQYTVCWIPSDRQRRPAFLAVGIHELANDPERSGGRSQYVAGRQVEYVRLFCFQYAGVAELGVSYAALFEAVRREQLPPGRSEPIPVQLPSGWDSPATSDPVRGLAPLVASLLLTSIPVCVLDADHLEADGRLAFIDDVLSLLPFGLRATLSASTWASPTAQDLKLRLFFSTARRDNGDRTCYVPWGRPDQVGIPYGRSEAAEFYLGWLKDASTSVTADLSRMTRPVRFTDDDISGMFPILPSDKSVADTFADLSASLRAADQRAVSAALRPLKRYLPRKGQPADLALYRSFVEKYEMLAEYPGLHHNTMRALYGTLLRLAFGDEVSYSDYCDIERAAGGNPGWTLRLVLVGTDTLTVLPCILTAKAGPGVREEHLMETLAMKGHSPGLLVSLLDREIGTLQPRHQRVLADFAVRYLCSSGAESRAELINRGYLSRLFAHAYPDELRKRQLTATLRYVHGNGDLTEKQITEVFAQPQFYPDELAEGVVRSLAPRKLWWFVETEAACARLTQAGHGADAAKLRQGRRRRALWARPQFRHAGAAPQRTIAMIPKQTINTAIFLLAFIVVCVVAYALTRLFGG